MSPPVVVAEAGTVAPVFVGAGARVELGPRLRFGAAGGPMPQAYLTLVNEVIQAFYPPYTDDAATLVDVALDRAGALRLSAGARPFRALGFTTDATYTYVGGAGATTGSELVEAFVGGDGRNLGENPPTVDARASLHLLGAEVGYEHRVWERLVLRGALGFGFTVAAGASIEAEVARGRRTVDGELAAEGEAALIDVLQGYAHTPTASVMLGWSFGPARQGSEAQEGRVDR